MSYGEVLEAYNIGIFPKGPSILVVGPDGVGKTTVCQQMSGMTGIPVWKCPSEKEIFKGRQFSDGKSLVFDYQLANFLEITGYRIISDRGYPCEWVYSRIFDRVTDEELLEMIDGRHADLRTKILYLFSSQLPTREDDLVPTEKYWDVKAGYDAFAEWSDCEVYAIDTCEMLEAYGKGEDLSREFAIHCMESLEITGTA